MKKTLLVLLTAFTLAVSASAQTAVAVYFEGGGPGLASFNFDTRLSAKRDGIGLRAGVGGYTNNDVRALYFPMQLNYLLGKDNRNFFELGAGATIVSYKDRYDDQYNAEHNGTFERSFGHLYFGYRRQPANGGFLFRAGICPIFNITSHNSFFIPYYGGVSVGYAF